MFFVALEGIDGVGKSTVHRGWWDEENTTFHSGLVHRLKSAGLSVVPSREPGSIDPDDPVRGSISKTYLEVERHLARSLNFLGAAYQKTEHPVVRRLLTAAGVVMRGSGGPTLFDYVQTGEKGPIAAHIQMLRQRWTALTDTAALDPTLFERLRRRNARDLIRQALVYSQDSATLTPTASGLLFLANHILHGEYLNTLPENTVVVSDRSADSNHAYGIARGDDPRIWELYEEYRFVPDLVILLTCPVEVAKNRTTSRHKRENKQWVRMQEAVAAAYNSMEYPSPVVSVSTDTDDYNAPIEASVRAVASHISDKRPEVSTPFAYST